MEINKAHGRDETTVVADTIQGQLFALMARYWYIALINRAGNE